MTWLMYWIKTLIMIVLFAAFLELLLPTSNMQRFVRLVMGLLIMMAIISPVIELVNPNTAQHSLDVIEAWKPKVSEANNEQITAAVIERTRLTREVYTHDIARHIASVVKALEGVEEVNVVVTLANKPNSQTGELEKILLYITPSIDKNKISTVTIGKDIPITGISPELQSKVIRTVAGLYQLRPEQIEVVSMKETK
ncbi:MAG: stage sporulation protein [Firmicutes bacterium]|nr:stage sporulation protein [Bacillota bacterium]